MGDKCLKSKKVFVSFMGCKHGASEQQSLEKGTITVVGMKQPMKLSSKTAFEALDYFEQEEWRIDKKNYKAKKDRVANNLA